MKRVQLDLITGNSLLVEGTRLDIQKRIEEAEKNKQVFIHVQEIKATEPTWLNIYAILKF